MVIMKDNTEVSSLSMDTCACGKNRHTSRCMFIVVTVVHNCKRAVQFGSHQQDFD